MALLWANDMVLLCCGQATAVFRTCSMAKTEANTAISMIAQIWNVCIVVTACTMNYQYI